jgi:hypothetical protein
MNSNSLGFALATAALLFASAASADLSGPGMADAGNHGPMLRTFAHARRLDVPRSQSAPENQGRESPSADDPFRSRPLYGAFPWLPAELINGVDALRFDRFDPRTGRRTVFAAATRRVSPDGSVR